MRNPFAKPLPKNEQYICRCGAKYSTAGKLNSHVMKRQIREGAGWELKGSHKFNRLVNHGTVVLEE